jgi:hypothetical protein
MYQERYGHNGSGAEEEGGGRRSVSPRVRGETV